MSENSHYFDGYYPRIAATELKHMVQVYGGKSSMRKQECIDFLTAALSSPATLRKTIDSLEPFERLSLALAKQMGGEIENRALSIGVLASGCKLPNRLVKNSSENAIASHLIKRGLFLRSSNRPGTFYNSYGNIKLFTDPRLLAHIGLPSIDAVPLNIAKPPDVTIARMPPTVLLDIISILKTVEDMGGLGLTQKGELRVNDLRKFQKMMQWPKGDLKIDGLVFRDGSNAILHALCHSDFIQLSNTHLTLQKSVEEVASQNYAEQILTLMNGFMRLSEWTEGSNRRLRSERSPQNFRAAFLIALTSLSSGSDSFYTVDEFEHELYERLDGRISLKDKFYTYRKTPAEVKQIEAEMRITRRQSWLQAERQWIETALTSWLYYLGMVELGLEAGQVKTFRLTALGKAVLHPTKDFSVSLPTENETAEGVTENIGTWIVQPNFDIMVYLDRTTPTQLAFLERHAQRTQSQQYTAHYRLTRDSIYRGLESGTTLDELIDELGRHAQAPLPQNVTVEIQEWAALRDQVILHHHANLLEFATATARQKAVKAGLSGTQVGDRFLLVAETSKDTQYPKPIQQVAYHKQLDPILNLTEDGLITLTQKPSDLWIEAQLDQWAERKRGQRWQLTSASVTARIKIGARINELITFLNQRAIGKLPPLLELALRNWAGNAKAAHLKPFALLYSDEPTVLKAALASERLKPYYRGRIENVLLFDPDHAKEVNEVLSWAGLKLQATK